MLDNRRDVPRLPSSTVLPLQRHPLRGCLRFSARMAKTGLEPTEYYPSSMITILTQLVRRCKLTPALESKRVLH
ncbi:hypothetical protein M0802_002486 [Mischocyttarus mexicanus]|nr:hypothetical protein M0802_002486 [Mischocyttarus mexicanus]